MRALMLRFARLHDGGGPRALAALPGLTLCAMIALAASYAAGLSGSPPMLCALLLGTALHYLSQEVRSAPGVALCATSVLRLGVGLLGARVTGAQIAGLGWSTLALVVVAAASTVACGLWVAHRLGLPRSLGMLAGGATAICGASAALAIAAVLPRHEALEKNTLAVVVLATLLSTLAMLVYPLAAQALALTPLQAGVFLGATIHDVAQVVVAGYALGPEVGDTASIVKLFRVAMLALVVAGVAGAAQAGYFAEGPVGARPRLAVPGFLWLFAAMAVLNSSGLLAAPVRAGADTVSRTCLLLGVAALGMKTSFAQLGRSGWRQVALMLATTLWIGGLVLGVVVLRH